MEYTSVIQQIEKLRSQGLLIDNEHEAREALSLFGYSNLIKNYRDAYIEYVDDHIHYKEGVSFSQITSLAMLDRNLRNIVVAAMLDLEEYVKAAAADVIASSFGIKQQEYLDFHNYANKKKRKERFTLTYILKTMNDTLSTNKDPIYYYSKRYNFVPPWILFSSVYFGTIVNYIDLFKRTQKELLANRLYNQSALGIGIDKITLLMMDTLYICSEYRNLAAHGGRVFDYKCKARLRTEEIFTGTQTVKTEGLSRLLYILSLLDYRGPYEKLVAALNAELSKHCVNYPEDVPYLSEIMGISIEKQFPVWVSYKSKIYHNDPHCSGIRNSQRMEMAEADELGYKPCKRCCKADQ